MSFPDATTNKPGAWIIPAARARNFGSYIWASDQHYPD